MSTAAMAGELPLESLHEWILASAVCWTAKAPDGAAYDLRWFRDGRILIAVTGEPRQVGFRAKASTIQAARLHAVRIAGLIADGITREADMGTPWSQMTPAQNLAARERLAQNAAGRARAEGDEDRATVQDRVLSRVRERAGQHAGWTEDR